MKDYNLNVRVYPIDEPSGSTLAFASVAVNDLAAIRGVRVVDSEKGLFVSMPQSKDKSGEYHDVAFPLSGDLRKEISAAVLDEFSVQANLQPDERGYEKTKTDPSSYLSADDVNINAKVFPVRNPENNVLAFASISLDDTVAIRGVRVVDGEKGLFVSMPQSRDKSGEYHDVAFPLSGDLRKEISKAVLAEYNQQTARRKHGLGERLAKGSAKSAQHAASAPQRSAAKQSPARAGLGD